MAQRILGLFVGLCAAWLLAELVLVFYQPEGIRTKLQLSHVSGQVLYHCYTSNPHGEFQPLPAINATEWEVHDFMIPPRKLPQEALSGTPYCVEYRYSSLGLRDRDYSWQPDPGVLRILGIGDSFAAGEGTPHEKTLFKQMETLLGQGYEVVNAGVSGKNTHDEVEGLRQTVPLLHCQRSIVVFLINDISMSPVLAERQIYINDLINVRDQYLAQHNQGRWFARGSRLLNLIGSQFEMRKIRQDTIAWYRDLYDELHNAVALQQLAADFQEIAATPNCQVALVLYPLMEDLEADYLFQGIHDKVAKLAQDAGLPVLDLAPTFRGQNTEAMQVHPSDHHPNGKAHALAASAIVAWLKQQPGFLDRPVDTATAANRLQPSQP